MNETSISVEQTQIHKFFEAVPLPGYQLLFENSNSVKAVLRVVHPGYTIRKSVLCAHDTHPHTNTVSHFNTQMGLHHHNASKCFATLVMESLETHTITHTLVDPYWQTYP